MPKTIIDTNGVFNFGTSDEIKIEIHGPSAVPFWYHDLKLEIALKLIQQVSLKDIHDTDFSEEELKDYVVRIKNAADRIFS